jgi:hypothetical protein
MSYDVWGSVNFFSTKGMHPLCPCSVQNRFRSIRKSIWCLRSSEKVSQMAYFRGLPSYYIKYLCAFLSPEIRDSLVCIDFVTIQLRSSCSYLTHSSMHIIQYDCHHRYSTRSLAFISEGFFFSQPRENLCYLSHFICSADKGVTFL